MKAKAVKLGLGTLALTGALAAMGQALAAGPAKPSAATPPAPAAPSPAPRAAPTPVASAAPADATARIEKGRELFSNYGCGTCHTLGDAGGTGHVGPSLDGDSNLSEAFIADRVTHGQGGMPSFESQLSKDEIATLAFYISQVAQK